MAFRNAVVGCGAVFLLLAAAPELVRAQNRQREQPTRSRRAAEQPKEQLTASGTIKAVYPGLLQIVTGDGQQWRIGVGARPLNISFTGAADKSWLRPGMFVQFTGSFNKRGQAQSPIQEVKAFTPREGFRIGVFPAAEPSGQLETPQGGEKPAKPAAASYEVAGRLTSCRKGWLRVATGQATVIAELAEDVRVSFDIADCRAAQAGDTIEVSAWYYRFQKGMGVAYATNLKIAAAQPLTGAAARGDREASKTAEKEPSDAGQGKETETKKAAPAPPP